MPGTAPNAEGLLHRFSAPHAALQERKPSLGKAALSAVILQKLPFKAALWESNYLKLKNPEAHCRSGFMFLPRRFFVPYLLRFSLQFSNDLH